MSPLRDMAASSSHFIFGVFLWLMIRWASGATLGQHVVDRFDVYIKEYGREYENASPEYVKRRALFQRRFNNVQAHNAKAGRRWEAIAGIFADRTDAERAAVRGWRRSGDSTTQGGAMRPGFAAGASLLALEAEPKVPVPKAVDYRFLQTASKVLDQGMCGSCWAATTATVLEAHYELHHGVPRSMSVQEILSCTPNPHECGGQGGCQGATVELGMQWALKNSVSEEDQVPYEAQDTDCARKSPDEEINLDVRLDKMQNKGLEIGLVGWQTVMPKNKAEPLMRAVIDWGPAAISVAGDAWHEYGGGIFDGCPKDVIVDHAVTLYGFGEEDQSKYWLIRNTWGPDWGENGYIRVLRHDDGESYCGTDTDNQQGVGCKNDPETVEVCGMCGMFSDSVVPHFAGARNLSRADAPHWLLDDHPGFVASIESVATASGVASAATALGKGVSNVMSEHGSSPSVVRRESPTRIQAHVSASARDMRD